MNRTICFGELLIDFICENINSSLVEGKNFLKKAGGAPANVTAAIAKLGGEATFIGKVGNDPFGVFLSQTLAKVGVDTDAIVLDENAKTTLAFVSLEESGERDFIFNRGADALLKLNEIDLETTKKSKVWHFGSATGLLGDHLTETYFQLLEISQEENIFTSFDPNYRVDLWKGRVEEFISLSHRCLPYADFVKVSDEETQLISGKTDLHEGVKQLHQLGAKVVAVTLGKEGTLISNNQSEKIVPSIPIKSIDSTGAGDAFVGASLFQIAQLENPKDAILEMETLEKVVIFANKVGAITCTQMGAIDALPTLEEVEKF